LTGRAVAAELAIATLFIALAIAMTWPLAMNLRTAIATPDDPLSTTWTIDWDYYATFHHASLFNANVFHPAKLSLAFGEHLYGIALMLFPLFAIGIAPLTIHNIAVLIGFAACGYAMFVLARSVTGSTVGAIVGGIAYAFVGFRFHHLGHLNIIWSFWLPLILWSLIRLARRATIGNAGILAITLLMNGLTSLHWLAFGTFAAGVTAIALGRDRRFWILVAASFGMAMLALLPFVIPYVRVAKMYGMTRSVAETLPNSAEWRDWTVPNLQSKLYGRHSPHQNYGHERTLFPGFTIYALAIVGLFFNRRDSRVSLVWIVIGALGARGLHGVLHTFLFEHIAGFRGMRMPVRWAMIAYVGLSVLVAAGVTVLVRNRRMLAIPIAAVMLFELRAAPIRYYLVPVEPRPLYDWIAKNSRGAIVELPMTQEAAYDYMWRATVHHRPLLNGVGSYLPPHYMDLLEMCSFLSPEFIDMLENMGCTTIIVHDGWLRRRTADTHQWLRDSVASGRLAFVRRFDAGPRPDYVFAITHNAHSPMPDLDAWSYSNVPIASVDRGPSPIVRGPLTISGWALAPAGVKRVNLRFANGRVVVRATRVVRPDVNALFPWYTHDPQAGFTATIDAGIRGDTDLQIEIVDNNGRTRRQSPFWFTWKRAVTPPHWNDAALDALLARLDAPRDAHERLANGTAAIEDFTSDLLTDREVESDEVFTRHILAVLLGDDRDARLANEYVEMLQHHTSREEVIARVLKSRQFAGAMTSSSTGIVPARPSSG